MTVRWRYQLAYTFIAVVSAALFFLLASQVSFETLYLYSRQHEDWQLDEGLWLFIVGTFALLAILALHSRRLTQEMSLRKAAEAAARDVSFFDEVTGLPNRRMFLEALDEKVAQARQDGTRVALLVIDFDNFRAINDTLGHAGGDRILRTIADRMEEQIRHQDTLARLGGDEFAILFPLTADAPVEDVFRLAERLLDTVRQPFPVHTGPIDLTGSIGVAKFPRDASSGDELLLDAERALLQAKRGGKNRYTLFDPSLDSKRRERAELEAELKAGMAAGQIVAFYQPLVRLSDHTPVGVEALARWRHPTRGLVGPGEFMDVAQDIGLMGCLLEQMLRRVCEDTAGWPEVLTIAVNVSPKQIVDEALAPATFSILDEAGFPPSRLEIEITETALMLDFDAARRTMLALKARGVQLALDDFGTGYSSLTHLHQLPFDKMKIDRSFIHGFIQDAQRRKIVSSMIQLGKSLELVTVAEGVECLEEAEWLRRAGCDLVQGYAFARPMPANEAELEWVAGAGAVNPLRMARVN